MISSRPGRSSVAWQAPGRTRQRHLGSMTVEVVKIMMQIGPRYLALSQMLFEQADDGLIHTHALAPRSLADRLIEIRGEVPERTGFHRSLCYTMCIIVRHMV